MSDLQSLLLKSAEMLRGRNQPGSVAKAHPPRGDFGCCKGEWVVDSEPYH